MDWQADYDSPWKEIIEQFFPEFIAFFFPDAHADIAWERGYTFLDKELQKIIRDSETGRRRVDKLAKVWRQSGDETWIAIHIEVQGQRDPNFAERMYQYHTLLYNHYKRQVVSLAILSDDAPAWRPDHFTYGLWGCRLRLEFPAVKLLDYASREDELAHNANPFAVVVLAHLQTQATTPDSPQRGRAKFRLVRRLYERGYTRQMILELFRFLDWIMTLTPPLAAEFEQSLATYEESQQMKYITTIERKGIEQGREQSMRDAVVEVLTVRFEEAPAGLQQRLDEIHDVDQLKTLHREAVLAPSLAAFVAYLEESV